MEIYNSKDGLVTKFIHDDGSETAFKNVSSCGNVLDKISGNIIPTEVDRNKFTFFLSSSVGCPIGCKFCYLTTKKYPYIELTKDQIVSNFKEAFLYTLKNHPEIRTKYIKIGWMGMGDAYLLRGFDLYLATKEILEWVLEEHKFCLGLDSVDISTTLPSVGSIFRLNLEYIKEYILKNLEINKLSNGSVVRLFYSSHSVIKRQELIKSKVFNNMDSVHKNLNFLGYINRELGIDIIIHQILLSGINDNKIEADVLKHIADRNLKEYEVRILRFNKCKNSKYEESEKFDELVKYYSKIFNKIKYQISAGSEIKAACGQFICKKIKKNKIKKFFIF